MSNTTELEDLKVKVVLLEYKLNQQESLISQMSHELTQVHDEQLKLPLTIETSIAEKIDPLSEKVTQSTHWNSLVKWVFLGMGVWLIDFLMKVVFH